MLHSPITSSYSCFHTTFKFSNSCRSVEGSFLITNSFALAVSQYTLT